MQINFILKTFSLIDLGLQSRIIRHRHSNITIHLLVRMSIFGTLFKSVWSESDF